ncbi:VOC family protein [Paraburkholderia elongata]|uniref:Extradiol dioxygenase n=1 Tax=Paraburkholderia elongata TaxID=2675747 RepID=A0A972NUF3_9BURK|nr:VOC family protein [Paraburkholderia elongata]NPT59167.1 extradiol dioxygenase [Paraburkholderia elongata]
MKLDHATIVTRDPESTRRFLCGIVGLSDGPRPPIRVGGYWLYADGRPVIHLVEATIPALAGKASPRIDHIALRVDDVAEWAALVDRMGSNNVSYTLSEVPLSDEPQLFVSLAPGVAIEVVTQLSRSISIIVD